jgi:hypothetical protein
MITPLMDKRPFLDSVQAGFDLSPPRIRQGVRLWVIAPETRKDTRYPNDLDSISTRLRRNARHVFFDSETGRPAFGPSDLLLFREASGPGFRLLVPDSPYAQNVDEDAFAAKCEAILSQPTRLGARGHSVQNICCLSFGAKRDDHGYNPLARTRLERALARLILEAAIHPKVALHECRIAEQMLRADSHRAIEAFLRESQAEALNELSQWIVSEEQPIRVATLFSRAARDFISAGLVAIAQHAKDAAHDFVSSQQYPLPGMEREPDTDDMNSPVRDLAFNPVVGFAIDVPDVALRVAAPASSIGITRYRTTKRLQLNDRDLCRIVNPLTSPSRRIVTTVKPMRHGLVIEAGHADAMRVLLRLSSAKPRCDNVESIHFDCKTLDFDRPSLRIENSKAVRVHASLCTPGPHDVTVQLGMNWGEIVLMRFRIPEGLQSTVKYA